MRPLIIGQDEKVALQKLAKFAEEHPLIVDGSIPGVPVGDNPDFVVKLPFGYRVVFSIEDQPGGMVRHLSMSVDTPWKVPNPLAVEMVMQEIGFESPLSDCIKRFEDTSPAHTAVNVWEKITHNKTKADD